MTWLDLIILIRNNPTFSPVSIGFKVGLQSLIDVHRATSLLCLRIDYMEISRHMLDECVFTHFDTWDSTLN